MVSRHNCSEIVEEPVIQLLTVKLTLKKFQSHLTLTVWITDLIATSNSPLGVTRISSVVFK